MKQLVDCFKSELSCTFKNHQARIFTIDLSYFRKIELGYKLKSGCLIFYFQVD